jgi:hypothetical protein
LAPESHLKGLQTQRITSSSIGLVILCVCRLPEDATQVPKQVGVKLTMNCVLWFVCYCVILSAFACRYIEYTKIHGMSNIKFRVEVGVLSEVLVLAYLWGYTLWEPVQKDLLIHTGCTSRNLPYLRRMFPRLIYISITKHTYIHIGSWADNQTKPYTGQFMLVN